jgi:cellulose synthase/poly-beta-1,6-N-acetylglucosamine synthase-like glycosyltransferase
MLNEPTSMYSAWIIAWIATAALAGLQFAFLTWGLWESRRFSRARLRKNPPGDFRPRVALFAPCKGLDVGIEDNVRALFEHDYSNYQLTFVVESASDTVCRCLQRLISDYPQLEAKVCVAGPATVSGQKVHNLWVATGDLPDDVEVLAFVDSDARPRSDWLRRLVARLPNTNVGAVTGYRWFRPTRATAAQCLLYSINTAIASGLGPGGHHLVWGGSWAIRRELFDSLRLRSAWQGTLSDDFVASRLIHRAGLRVDFEPGCMVMSPVDGSWRQTLEFIRRQYIIARSYAPHWWLLALTGATLPVITFWGGILALATGLSTGAEWTWLPAVICPAYYAATLIRGWQRWQLAQVHVSEPTPLVKRVAWLDIWTGPLVTLVNWLAILSSVAGRRLQWRGIGYTLGRGGRVLGIERSERVVKQTAEGPQRCDEGRSTPSRARKSRVTV